MQTLFLPSERKIDHIQICMSIQLISMRTKTIVKVYNVHLFKRSIYQILVLLERTERGKWSQIVNSSAFVRSVKLASFNNLIKLNIYSIFHHSISTGFSFHYSCRKQRTGSHAKLNVLTKISEDNFFIKIFNVIVKNHFFQYSKSFPRKTNIDGTVKHCFGIFSTFWHKNRQIFLPNSFWS